MLTATLHSWPFDHGRGPVDGLADLVGDAGGFSPVLMSCSSTMNSSPPWRAGRSLARAVAQALGRFDEQHVAGGVAEAVVDLLEAVEVEEQHGEAGPVAAGDEQAGVGVLEEHRAVGEAGEGVVGGQVMDALPDPCARRCR